MFMICTRTEVKRVISAEPTALRGMAGGGPTRASSRGAGPTLRRRLRARTETSRPTPAAPNHSQRELGGPVSASMRPMEPPTPATTAPPVTSVRSVLTRVRCRATSRRFAATALWCSRASALLDARLPLAGHGEEGVDQVDAARDALLDEGGQLGWVAAGLGHRITVRPMRPPRQFAVLLASMAVLSVVRAAGRARGRSAHPAVRRGVRRRLPPRPLRCPRPSHPGPHLPPPPPTSPASTSRR